MVQSRSYNPWKKNIGMKVGEVYVIHKTPGLKRLELIHISIFNGISLFKILLPLVLRFKTIIYNNVQPRANRKTHYNLPPRVFSVKSAEPTKGDWAILHRGWGFVIHCEGLCNSMKGAERSTDGDGEGILRGTV